MARTSASRRADAVQEALARIGGWAVRALHAGGFLLAVYAVGSAWVGYLLLPAIAVLLVTGLTSAVRAERLRPALAYGASTLALALTCLAAGHAWSSDWAYLLALAERGSLGPVGANEEHAWLCANLIAALGAMLAAVAAGRRDLWGAFAWFVWSYWAISIVGCVAGLADSTYDVEHEVFVSLPTGALLAASAAFAVVLVVALLRRARRLEPGVLVTTRGAAPTTPA